MRSICVDKELTEDGFYDLGGEVALEIVQFLSELLAEGGEWGGTG